MPNDNPRGTRWCFTLNNPTPDDETLLRSGFDASRGNRPFRFIVFGLEHAPTTGTPHYQGYFELWERKYRNALHAIDGLSRAAFTLARGSAEDNIRYCTKESTVCTLGNPVNGGSSKGGQATRERYATAFDLAAAGDLDSIDADLRLRHYDTLQRISDRAKWINAQARISDVCLVLYRWQSELCDFFDGPPHPRSIYFVCDASGGCGKSTFARQLRRRYPGLLVLQPGKGVDLAFILSEPPSCVVFDVPRASIEHVPWGFVESVKNGYIVSTKYNGCVKEFPIPHVAIFCNAMPPDGTLSEDRIVNIEPLLY